ncbi:sugar kinase [Pseudomonas resinovorans]|uniref:sugar kinase n=1 Tax=Metapseudomonas resinovorans TaxID=53412 RepID=UPI00237FB267|nr:sugar kinase [Pseudomonas resinovorans]MDE3736546.1 sugar kinase [Pseudomonas resinovorans]
MRDCLHIACLGECMVELSGQPLQRRYGGDTLNTALYMARLLAGSRARVHYISALGDDRLSDELIHQWQCEGIETVRVTRLPGTLPGLYLVDVDPQGERSFLYWRDTSAARQYFAMETDFSAWLDRGRTDALYLSGVSLALLPANRRLALLDALEGFVAEGGRLWFDNNFRPALWSAQDARAAHERVLAMAEIALLTLDDEHQLYGQHTAEEAARRTVALGCTEVVIKQGAQPCLIATAQREIDVPAQAPGKVVDSCAAGDAFAAAYLASRIQGLSAHEAAANGHCLAATVIGHPGAIIPAHAMPDISLPR